MCGSSRGLGEDMTIDGNRQYQANPSPSAYQAAYITALNSTVTALGLGAPMFAVDYHQHQSYGPFLLYPVTATNTAFADRVIGYNGNFTKNNQAYVADQGTSINFWHQVHSTHCSMIHETKNSETQANCVTYGENFMHALADSLAAGEMDLP
jgi:hypothetical protein